MSFSNLGMSEWLIACAVVLLAVVLVDGYRRMREERRRDIKWDLQLSRDLPDEDELHNEELLDPYRIVNRQNSISNASSADLSKDDHADEGEIFAEASDTHDAAFEQGDLMLSANDTDTALDEGLLKQDDGVDVAESEAAMAQENMQLIVFHVKAKSAQGFIGSDIVQVLLACNMRYGENQILHRYTDTQKNSGPVEFSVANMLEPGTFDLDNLSGFRTPGVTFFMALPGSVKDPLKSFNTMLETAQCLVGHLDGVLLDEEHSTANLQVINHYRDRVRGMAVGFAEA